VETVKYRLQLRLPKHVVEKLKSLSREERELLSKKIESFLTGERKREENIEYTSILTRTTNIRNKIWEIWRDLEKTKMTFEERKEIIQDIFEKYREEIESDIKNVKNEKIINTIRRDIEEIEKEIQQLQPFIVQERIIKNDGIQEIGNIETIFQPRKGQIDIYIWIGGMGSGKTYFASRVVYTFWKKGKKILVFDPLGTVQKNKYIPGRYIFVEKVYSFSDFFNYIKKIIEKEKIVILSGITTQEFQKLIEKNKLGVDMIFIDEFGTYFSQQQEKKEIYTKTKEIMNLRNFGVEAIFGTAQRYQQFTKELTTNMTYFLGRLDKQNMDYFLKTVGVRAKDKIETIYQLLQSEEFLFFADHQKINRFVKIKENKIEIIDNKPLLLKLLKILIISPHFPNISTFSTFFSLIEPFYQENRDEIHQNLEIIAKEMEKIRNIILYSQERNEIKKVIEKIWEIYHQTPEKDKVGNEIMQIFDMRDEIAQSMFGISKKTVEIIREELNKLKRTRILQDIDVEEIVEVLQKLKQKNL